MYMLRGWPLTQAECGCDGAIVSWVRHLVSDANNRYTFYLKCSGSDDLNCTRQPNSFIFTYSIDGSGQVAELDAG